MKPPATSITATAATAAFSYRVMPLVIEHEPSRERGEHHEQYVQVDQKARRLAGATATAAHRGLDSLTADHDERDPQRQREQRQQQLTRAHSRNHGGEQATEHGHADGGEEDGGNHIEGKRRSEEKGERGQEHGLADDEHEA